MADFEFELALEQSELLNRPDQSFAVKGQAGLLAVALALDVPILSQQNSINVDGNPVLVGAGASFSVSKSVSDFEPDPTKDLVNKSANAIEWYQSGQVKNGFRRFVTKKLVAVRERQDDFEDAGRLSAMINEIRILSTEAIRNCQFIVSLLCVSWHECPTVDGRFWPQLVLEASDRGTLEDYLTEEKPNFTTQLMLLAAIERGMAFVHAHGIVHGDLKPQNILVFMETIEPDRRAVLEKGDYKPIEAKICDFGFAVILDDYPEDEMFQSKLGTMTWMAPELVQQKSIPLRSLHKADLYSFGLVAASIFMQSPTPFPGMTGDQISAAKDGLPSESGSVLSIFMDSIKERRSTTEIQEEYIEALLAGLCEPDAQFRVCLPALSNFLFLGLGQSIGEDTPRLPLDYFPDLYDAGPGYYNALRAFNRKFSKSKGQNGDNLKIADSLIGGNTVKIISKLQELLSQVRTLRLGGPENEAVLSNLFVDNTPASVPIRSFAKVRRARDEFESTVEQFDEMSGIAVQKIPDLAFENEVSFQLLQRVAGIEIVRDLERQASSVDFDDPLVVFQLAGCYINGQLVEPDIDIGLSTLNKAIDMDSFEAIAIATNVYKACHRPMPDKIRKVVRNVTDSRGIMSLTKSGSLLFSIRYPRKIELDHIFAKTWAEDQSRDYVSWLASDERRMLGSALAICNNPLILRADVPSKKPLFNFSQIQYFQKFGPEKFDYSKKNRFIDDVNRFSCLEKPDDMGFTLLQTAVVKGDIELAKILINDLGADVNEYGNTYGWTPLLLACQCGHFAIAQWLVECGANVACRDVQGASILHALHQFSTREQCEAVVQWALVAGLEVNCRLREGFTPLHASLIGWDFSQGAATEVLLENGADPSALARGNDGYFNRTTPIGLCAESLDVKLLERMLAAASKIPNARRSVAFCKAQAFWVLSQKTRLYYMSVSGRDYEARLISVLRMIIDDEMNEHFGSEDLHSWISCLYIALHHSRGVFVEALLTACPEIDVNYLARRIPKLPITGRPFLHIAIERRGSEAVRSLIGRDANLLTKGHSESNALHVAAHYFPAILCELIEFVEKLPSEMRNYKTMKEILEEPDSDGKTVFGVLLQEGYSVEKDTAESLRKRYSLEYDVKIFREDGSWGTLTRSLIATAVSSALLPIGNIRYLLDLKPVPQFICDSIGNTLLTTAMQGVMSYQSSNDTPSNQIVDIVLKRYGTFSNILLGPGGATALHMAAFWASKAAIEMIANHIESKFPRESVPWNGKDTKGYTVLDYARQEVGQVKLYDEADKTLDGVALTTKKAAAVECYVFLRGKGALHSWELRGNGFAARPILQSNTLKNLGQFIVFASIHLGLGPPDVDLDDVVEVAQSSPSGSNLIRVPIIELAWTMDNFHFRVYKLRLSSELHELIEEFVKYVRERRQQDNARLYGWMNLPPGIFPFMRTTYEHDIDNSGIVVKWTRGGRVWTLDEFQALRHRFSELWDDYFEDDQQKLLEMFARDE